MKTVLVAVSVFIFSALLSRCKSENDSKSKIRTYKSSNKPGAFGEEKDTVLKTDRYESTLIKNTVPIYTDSIMEFYGGFADSPVNFFWESTVLFASMLFKNPVNIFEDIPSADTSYSIRAASCDFLMNVEIHSSSYRSVDLDGCAFWGLLELRSPYHFSIPELEQAFFNEIRINNSEFHRSLHFIDGISASKITFSDVTIWGDSLGLKGHYNEPPSLSSLRVPSVLIYDCGIIDSTWSDKMDFSSCLLPDNRTVKSQLHFKNIDHQIGFIVPSEVFYITFDEAISNNSRMAFFEKLIVNCKESAMYQSVDDWTIEFKYYQNIYNYGFFGKILNFFQKK
ncbi:hypothetical protein [Dyadobacter fanqingshengii]|uniref:Uncharacterized protein n=1 Tax=Dyadobacter fanqingshengii TaxID=2906443 RepID=A0A9X1PAJ1_9BACT|nr:hypothetical protein [Dyadobacter fanqingshengii]MCF0039747.1 hypothetical protein [Dyadobacter fanqingshengii]USJ38491.1 hypothetical protein NFI81_12060 [Dyadobacter fanqingshengii]